MAGVPRAVRARPARRAAHQPARDGAGRPGHRVRGAARRPGAASSPRPSTTRNWPTCSRRCRSRTRSGCSTAWASIERSADVVEEMQPDDAADLLGEMPPEQRERLLTAMQSVQAEDLRRLLRYDKATAGGLMTSQPLGLRAGCAGRRGARPGAGTATCPATTAAQVYVCEPPMLTPTGRYLGSVGFQRLLRRAPSDPGRRVHRGARLRPARPARARAGRAAGRLQPHRRRGVRQRWAGWSARSPSTTCSTGCCRSAGARIGGNA